MFEKLINRWIDLKQERLQNSKKCFSELNKATSIFIRYRIQKVYLFGSVLRGSSSTISDIDLYVEGIENKLYWEFLRDLKDTISYDIDLYIQSDDPQFVKKIKERGIKIYDAKY